MAYWITKFGTTNLPTRAQTQDVGTGEARSGLVTLPDGSGFDAYGANPTRVRPWELSVKGAVVADSEAALHTAASALYALVGRSDYLYRTPDGGTANSQRIRARCLRADFSRDVRHRLWAEPTLRFEVQSPTWEGTADVTTVGTLATSGTLTVTNAGDATVWGPVFQVVPSGALTAFQLNCWVAGYWAHMCYGTAYGTGATGGTVPAGGTLLIDCANYAVTVNGTAAYSRFELGTYHELDAWAVLRAGTTTPWAVTFGGGGNVVLTCTHRSAYA